tara:strand:+ start:4587 stop:4994 length:408 start_codon:yes stop_codon:yes gene_type:complete
MGIPAKYLNGLSLNEKKKRVKRIREGMKSNSRDPKAYRPFPTDKGKKTRKSVYTAAFEKKYSEKLKGLKGDKLRKVSKVTKIPYKTLKTVYDRGLAAWRTGHRPGASQQAWGWARVYSFVMKGKTYFTADSDLKH